MISPINAKGDVTTEYPVVNGTYGDTAEPYCYTVPAGTTPAGMPVCGNGNNAKVTVPIPMEAKLGVRYHKPRADVPYDAHRRDPIAQDLFDVEADFTWANDSAFDYLEIHFPGTATGGGILPANPGIAGSTIPPNADVQHHFRDVFGVRVGGDYNVLPDKLAIRAGSFFETQAANSVYQNIDFDGAMRFGLALGGVRSVGRESAFDIMLGYGHVFFGTLSNDSQQGLPALAGTQCLNGQTAGSGCSYGGQPYRTAWPVNLGTITSSINVINVGFSYKFGK